MVKTRERRAKPSRTVRLVRGLAGGVGVVAVTAGKETTYYTVVELPCEIGGRGFAVHKLGMGPLYHVRVGEPGDCSCECMGFLRHGCCKHVLGLRALVEAGEV